MFTRRRIIVLYLSLIFSVLIVAPVSASVIDGPVLSSPERGWGDFGLMIRAEADVTLVSVSFPNQGLEDNVDLIRTSDWELVASIPVPAGNRNATVNINYPLAAHEIYLLVATTPNNKYYGRPGLFSFPAGNPEITVLASYLGAPYYSLYSGLWFTFNNITTQVGQTELNATIDIKPGSDINSINLKSKGVVPVAIMTTAGFDALDANLESIKFAGASPIDWHYEDLNGDGNLDVLLHCRTEELTDLSPESTEAVLTGTTYDGDPFVGKDTVNVVPKK